MAFISLPAAKSAFPSAVCFPGVCSDSGGKGYGRTVPVWGWVCLDTSEGNHCWQAEGRAHHVRAGALSQVMLLLSPWWEIYLTQRLLKEEWARQANMKFCSPPLRKTVFCSACSSDVTSIDYQLMPDVWNLLTFKWSAFMWRLTSGQKSRGLCI